MTNIYKVTIQRLVDYEIDIEAETEEEALNIANNEFDNQLFNGYEMYDCNSKIEKY